MGICLTIFGGLSLICLICFLCTSIGYYKKRKRAKQVVSAFQLFTLGVFFSILLMLVPMYYLKYDFGDKHTVFRPFLLSLHGAFRAFILEGDYQFVIDSLKGHHIGLRVCYGLYASTLYVLAPVLTFGNILSLFKHLKDEWRYAWYKGENVTLYIMSELNEKSIALAESIRRDCPKGDKSSRRRSKDGARQKKKIIVFTDVFVQNEEDDFELLNRARDLNAICLKRDIAHLDFMDKKGNVELFLIGDDESENVSQAVKITNSLNKENKKFNVKVFVFSTQKSASYVVDSITYDNLLEQASKHDYGDCCFKLRRIDEKRQLIWNTIKDMHLYDLAKVDPETGEKIISVLIVGFGSYGMEFFKTLVWYCQFEGYKLQINILDKHGRSEDNDYIESVINGECPELLRVNRSDKDGESKYDIRIFSGVDVLTDDISKLFLYDDIGADKREAARRIKATSLALVSLGDDDTNIEVSIRLRGLFDRINGVVAQKKSQVSWNSEAVQIYSVVFDDQKSETLFSECEPDSNVPLLVNHRAVPYHIHFIGSMSTRFSYDNIYNAELETRAYRNHHIGWVDIEKKIHDEWEKSGVADKLHPDDWGYEYCNTPDAIAEERKKYEKYEYYRLSSIAKELYQAEVAANTELSALATCSEKDADGKVKQTCECDNCIRRKKSEHMRWNAYTRVMGFSYGKPRADRALLHDNLCLWSELSYFDRLKD